MTKMILKLAVCGIWLSGAEALAWGQYGHEQINAAAIELLPQTSRLGQCLRRDPVRYAFVRHAITPDAEWKSRTPARNLSRADAKRRRENDRFEHPLHYFEVDAYLPPHSPQGSIAALPAAAFQSVLTAYERLLSRNARYVSAVDPGKPVHNPVRASDVALRGTAPWRARQLYHLALRALGARKTRLALFYLGTMGHMIGDISQPFHTTMNYDGNYDPDPGPGHDHGGIHHEIDTGLLPQTGKDDNSVYADFGETQAAVLSAAHNAFERYGNLTENDLVPQVLQIIESGYPLVDLLLRIYQKQCGAANEGLQDAAYCRIQPSRPLPRRIEREFASALTPRGSVRSLLENRLGESAALLAKLIGAAEAYLPQDWKCKTSTLKFNQSFAIRNYPLPDYLQNP